MTGNSAVALALGMGHRTISQVPEGRKNPSQAQLSNRPDYNPQGPEREAFADVVI